MRIYTKKLIELASTYKGIIILISSTSALGGLMCSIIGYMTGAPIHYYTVALFVFIIFSMNIVTTTYFSEFVSKLFYSMVTPTWYLIGILFVGGGFAEGAAIVTNMGFIFVFFRGKPIVRNWLMIYGFISSFACILYVNFAGPIFEPYNNPVDEIFTILISAFWLFMIFAIYEIESDALVDELKKKNKDLISTTKELKEFTYIASHDLKSPVVNILGFVDLVKQEIEKQSYENSLKHLSFIKTSADQMNRLISDVLEYSEFQNVDGGGPSIVNLNHILESVKRSMHQEIQNTGANIFNSSLPCYFCNETQITLVFQNIIQNGIKYNLSEKPEVRIWSETKDESILLYFKDNGIGIDEEYHERIFEFFQRLHTRKEFDGTGIGLGLCKKIINKMEGTITLKSDKGSGTTFIIELPISQMTSNQV